MSGTPSEAGSRASHPHPSLPRMTIAGSAPMSRKIDEPGVAAHIVSAASTIAAAV